MQSLRDSLKSISKMMESLLTTCTKSLANVFMNFFRMKILYNKEFIHFDFYHNHPNPNNSQASI